MIRNLLSLRIDLPFYLRLPVGGFFTWDPEFDSALILPRQAVGEICFRRNRTELAHEVQILDQPSEPLPIHEEYTYALTSEFEGREVPTLKVCVAVEGGWTELRPYSEVVVFIAVHHKSEILGFDNRRRAFDVLNAFLDKYRVATQDPWVRRIEQEFDTYFQDASVGGVPESLHHKTAGEILQRLKEVRFSSSLGPNQRAITIRTDILDDLFPGKILDAPNLRIFVELAKRTWDLPLHYDLLLTAQHELKGRRYYQAVLEAETGFEVYVSRTLRRLSVHFGASEDEVVEAMSDPRKLSRLDRRISEVDKLVQRFRSQKYLEPVPGFEGSKIHEMWKERLYKLRNRITHGGYRDIGFEQAKDAIAAAKAAIALIESWIPGFAEPIQIDSSTAHLNNTAGRLRLE